MKNILISGCLLGIGCRYDGKKCKVEGIKELTKLAHLIPVCPEQLGGLPTPRAPAEIRNKQVINKDEQDVTKQFQEGAKECIWLAKMFDCDFALLKSKSPSCGKETVYDGTFSNRLTQGNGITVQMLRKEGVQVFDETEIQQLIALLQAERQ